MASTGIHPQHRMPRHVRLHPLPSPARALSWRQILNMEQGSRVPVKVEPMQPGDWRQVRRIFAEGLATGLAAFWPKPPIWRDWNAGHLELGRLVVRDAEGTVVGWSALAPAPET